MTDRGIGPVIISVTKLKPISKSKKKRLSHAASNNSNVQVLSKKSVSHLVIIDIVLLCMI